MGYTDDERARLIAAGMTPEHIDGMESSGMSMPEPTAAPVAPGGGMDLRGLGDALGPERVGSGVKLREGVEDMVHASGGLGDTIASQYSQASHMPALPVPAGVVREAARPLTLEEKVGVEPLPGERGYAPPEQQDPGALANVQPVAPAYRPPPRRARGPRGPSGMELAQGRLGAAMDALEGTEQRYAQKAEDSAWEQAREIQDANAVAADLQDQAMARAYRNEEQRQADNAIQQAAAAQVEQDRQQLQRDYDAVGDNRTGGQKFVDLLAIAIGGVGAALKAYGGADGHNNVVDMIERRIQRDIDQQFKRLDKRGAAIDGRDRQIQMARAAIKDDAAARDWLVSQELRRAGQVMESAEMRRRAAAMGMDGTQIRGAAETRARERDVASAQQQVQAEYALARERAKAAGAARKREQSRALPPGFRVADPDRFEGVGQQAREKAIEAANVGRRLVDVDARMNQLFEKHGVLTRFGSLSALAGAMGQDGANVAAEIESLHAQKTALMNRALELGALDEGGKAIVEGSIGTDPTSIFKSGYQAKSSAAAKTIADGVRRDLERVGLASTDRNVLSTNVRRGAR